MKRKKVNAKEKEQIIYYQTDTFSVVLPPKDAIGYGMIRFCCVDLYSNSFIASYLTKDEFKELIERLQAMLRKMGA